MQNTKKTDLNKVGTGELQDKLSRYEAHKGRSKEFMGYLKNYFYECGHEASLKEANLRKQIPRVEACGSYLLFRDYYLKEETRLVSANFCMKHTLCGLCAVRRAAKGAQNLHEKAKQVLSDPSDLKAYYVVLTVKNEPDLGYGMRKLRKGWNRIKYTIRDAKRARKTQNPRESKYAGALDSEFSDVAGGAYSIEITYNEQENTWHPHMNLLVLSESEMSNGNVSKEWKNKTGDSYITHCKEKDPVEDKGVVCEIMKYAMKFSELEFEQNLEAYLALYGQQLKGTIGAFRGVDLEPDPNDDTLEGQPFIEILFSYCGGEYQETGNRRAGIESCKSRKNYVRSDLISR